LSFLAGILSCSLTRAQDVADPLQAFTSDDQSGRDQSLSMSHNTVATNVLVLGVVDAEEVVRGLLALDDGEEDKLLAISIYLLAGLLQGGQTLVDLVQDTRTEMVGLLDIRRDILVGLGENRQYGLRERLICGVAQLYRSLAVGIALVDFESIVDDGVAGDVLKGCRGRYFSVNLGGHREIEKAERENL